MRIFNIIFGVVAVMLVALLVGGVNATANDVPAGSTVWEDGSYRTPEGGIGCLPGALCQDAGPVR